MLHQGDGTWELWAGDARVGRTGDGVRGKAQIVLLPAYREGAREARPRFVEGELLTVEVGPARVAEEAADDEGELVSRRRRILGKPAIALHRIALAAVRRLPPPRTRPATAGRPAVRIVLTNAHAMGGTVRATLNLARHLAERHEVELIAIRRLRRKPFFAFPPGLRVTSLDDRTAEPAGPGRAAARAAAEPARASGGLRATRRRASGPTSSSCGGCARRAATSSSRRGPPGRCWPRRSPRPAAVVIAQEHMHFNAHRPALAAAIRRRYGRSTRSRS